MRARKIVAAFGAVLILVTIGALGGAETSRADTVSDCAGRPFCVDITDQDGVSRSIASTHYMVYTLTIRRNGGTQNLVGGTSTLTLTDIVGTSRQASTAVFQEGPSDQRCSAGSGQSSHIVTCAVPNLPAGAGDVVYYPLLFSTTTVANALTEMNAEVRYKEKGSDKPPSDPQDDTANAINTVLYEGNVDEDVSWAFPTANITLATTSTNQSQHATFHLPTIPPATAFEAFVQETDVDAYAGLSGLCLTTCHGQIVETEAGGTGPVNVVITWNFKPSGFTENGGVVYHLGDDATTPDTIDEQCTFGPSGGVPTNMPCRTITIDHLGRGQVEVTTDVWSADNGGWGVG